MKKLRQILAANRIDITDEQLIAAIKDLGADPGNLSDDEIASISNQLISQDSEPVTAIATSKPRSMARKKTKAQLEEELEALKAQQAQQRTGASAIDQDLNEFFGNIHGALDSKVNPHAEGLGLRIAYLPQEGIQKALHIAEGLRSSDAGFPGSSFLNQLCYEDPDNGAVVES